MKRQEFIFISQGDIAGIGWPILKKILASPKKYFTNSECIKLCQLVIVGFSEPAMKKLFTVIQVNNADVLSASQSLIVNKIFTKPIFLAIGNYNKKLTANNLTAKMSYQAFDMALNLTYTIKNSSLVTLPVSKENIIKAGIPFQGHTEVIARQVKRKVFMCMYHREVSVFLLTNHIPLNRVADAIQKVDYKALSQALRQFTLLFKEKRAGVMLGLNPHAGENGKIGNEEKFLTKKIDFLKKEIYLEGPVPADSFFMKENRKNYGWAIACYHDQGLIPFKTLFGFKGLNVTMNIHFLRVSPDHGTAFDLTAKGKPGDHTGVLSSLQFAMKWGHQWKLQ